MIAYIAGEPPSRPGDRALPGAAAAGDRLRRSPTFRALAGGAWRRWRASGTGSSLRTAEMMKHALNAFLGAKHLLRQRARQHLRRGRRRRKADRRTAAPGAARRPEGDADARPRLLRRHAGARHADAARAGPIAKLGTPLLDGAWKANEEQNRLVVRKLESVIPNLRDAA